MPRHPPSSTLFPYTTLFRSVSKALAIPRPWLIRMPFVIFGVWLGAALWWVSRRLFDDAGGYVALALYCSSPAMVKISSNVGEERSEEHTSELQSLTNLVCRL